jgi:flavodoxin I
MKIGIFYGSTTGNTANAAKAIKSELESLGEITLQDISDADISKMEDYDLIILGSSTWGLGEIQDDWIGKELLGGVDLSGRKVAVFGTGDQCGYDETFVESIGILADAAEKAGATLVGKWPTDSYDFSRSAAVRDGQFAGLALDEDNQADMTTERIKKWAEQLKREI